MKDHSKYNPLMPLLHKVGDKVVLTDKAVRYYGGAPPYHIPEGQGGGRPGTILFAGDRPYKPGADPRPYMVRWDNGVENSYRAEDLQAAPKSFLKEVKK